MTIKPLLLAGLAGTILALAACDSKKPGEDSVATVDGYEVTISELNHELAESGVRDTADPAARRAALQAIINRKLLAKLAQDGELDRTPDFILREQRMQDLLLADAAVQSLAPKDSGGDVEAINSYLKTNLGGGRERTIYAIDGLQFARPDRQDVMDKLTSAHTLEQIRSALRSASIIPQGAKFNWDSAALPTELVSQLNRLPGGEPFLIPQGNNVVAGVILAKQAQPIDPQQARRIAEAAVGQQTIQARVADWLQQARGSATIEYADGFAPDAADTASPRPASPAAEPTSLSTAAAAATPGR